MNRAESYSWKIFCIRVMELACAACVTFIILLIVDYACPIRIFNMVPNYILSPEAQPTTLVKHITLDALIKSGQIMSAKDLYERVIEYYHFLIAGLLGAFIFFSFLTYLNTKRTAQEIAEDTERKIEEKINQSKIETRIGNLIRSARIEEKIDKKIEQSDLVGKIVEDISQNEDYLQQLNALYQAQIASHQTKIAELENTSENLQAVIIGLETEITKIKEKIDGEEEE